jgi:hypothetical protein
LGGAGEAVLALSLVEVWRFGMNKRDYPPRIRQLLEAQGYFALTTEERIAKHEEAMRVLAGIDRGMGMEHDGCLCDQCSRWLDCLLRQKSKEA